MRIAVFSNDIIPGLGLPVAAPGLRAWGVALGLRDHGHDVSLLIDDRVLPRVWHRKFPPPMPPQTLALHPRDLERYCSVHRIDALIITNSNPTAWLTEALPCILIYDFFAPKMLELREHLSGLPSRQAEIQMDALAERKIRGLKLSDGVVVNGAKKMPYVQSWLARAGVQGKPCSIVNMGLPHLEPHSTVTWPLDVVVSGYVQPWSQPGPWVEDILPALDSGMIRVHLLIGNHWGTTTQENPAGGYAMLRGHPGVVEHGTLEFNRFRSLLRTCDLSVDVFTRNPERELAMVTRSIVALSCGVPVVHVPFTEVSSIIEDSGAGWLVHEKDPQAVSRILQEVAADEEGLRARKIDAARVARDTLEPKIAIMPMIEMLEALA